MANRRTREPEPAPPPSRMERADAAGRRAVALASSLAAATIALQASLMLMQGMDVFGLSLTASVACLALLALRGPEGEGGLGRRVRLVAGYAGTVLLLAAAVVSTAMWGAWWHLPLPALGGALIALQIAWAVARHRGAEEAPAEPARLTRRAQKAAA